jgi:hypothetical protein
MPLNQRVAVVAFDEAIDIPAAITMSAPTAPFHPPPLVAALRRQTTPALWWRLPIYDIDPNVAVPSREAAGYGC